MEAAFPWKQTEVWDVISGSSQTTILVMYIKAALRTYPVIWQLLFSVGTEDFLHPGFFPLSFYLQVIRHRVHSVPLEASCSFSRLHCTGLSLITLPWVWLQLHSCLSEIAFCRRVPQLCFSSVTHMPQWHGRHLFQSNTSHTSKFSELS